MALDDLQAVIESLQSKIELHRAHLSENETRTRQVLIDPLLKELGWDVSDPDQVQLEYSAGGGRADYALMSQGKPVAVIEAKKLGYRLDQNETLQVLNYANSRGIAHMAVTNGDEWRMYDVFAQKPIEDRVIMEFSITQTPAHESALQSLRIWNPNVSSGSGPVGASESIVQTASGPESLMRTQVETAYSGETSSTQSRQREKQSQTVTGSRATGLSVEEDSITESESGNERVTQASPQFVPTDQPSTPDRESGWIPLTELHEHSEWKSSDPKWIRFEDSKVIELNSGMDLMNQVILWIWDRRPVTKDWLEFSTVRGSKPVSTSRDDLRNPLKLKDGLYFHKANFSNKRNRLRVPIELLDYFGYDESDVYVKF